MNENTELPKAAVEIEDLREFATKHNQDIVVLTTWNWDTKGYTFTTVGSNRDNSDAAVRLLEIIEKALNVDLSITRDLRDQHPQLRSDVLLAMLRLFRYSMTDIDFDYEGLTYLEKALITPDQFKAVYEEMKRLVMDAHTTEKTELTATIGGRAPVPEPEPELQLRNEYMSVLEADATAADLSPSRYVELLVSQGQIARTRRAEGCVMKWFDKNGKEMDQPVGCGGE